MFLVVERGRVSDVLLEDRRTEISVCLFFAFCFLMTVNLALIIIWLTFSDRR